MANQPPNEYLRNAVMTASPEQLHLMLYDGAIRFCLQARDAIEAKDYETSYHRLSRAQAIINEMQNGLRPEVNPELCERMSALYNFMYRKMVDASINRSVSDLDDVVRLLRYQRETWVMLIENVSKARIGAEGAASEPQSPQPAAGAPAPPPANAPAGSTLSIEG